MLVGSRGVASELERSADDSFGVADRVLGLLEKLLRVDLLVGEPGLFGFELFDRDGVVVEGLEHLVLLNRLVSGFVAEAS